MQRGVHTELDPSKMLTINEATDLSFPAERGGRIMRGIQQKTVNIKRF